MELDALMYSSCALLCVAIFGHVVAAPMSHVEIVTYSLFLFVPATVTMQPRGQIGLALTVSLAPSVRVLLGLLNMLRLLWSFLFFGMFALGRCCRPSRRGRRWNTTEAD